MSKRGYDVAGVAKNLGTAFDAAASAYNSYKRFRSTMTQTRSTNVQSNGGSQVTRRRRRIGRSKKWNLYRSKQAVLGAYDEQIYRWQASSQTYLGPGLQFLGWSNTSTPQLQQMPCHIMSLTNNVAGLTNGDRGCYNGAMTRVFYDQATGRFSYSGLNHSQTPAGAFNFSNNAWQLEKNYATFVPRNVFHKYTNIKLNLYGCIDVPIHYDVMLISFDKDHDPYSDPTVPYDSDSDVNYMFKDWMRTRLYDSVGSNAMPKWQKNTKIVKQERITIQPPPRSDAVDFTNQPSNIHELRWFIRHDRRREYRWSKLEDQTINDLTFLGGGWDVSTQAPLLCDCEWEKRLYLVIMASSPENIGIDQFDAGDVAQVRANANTQRRQGSYDIVVRNCFLFEAT